MKWRTNTDPTIVDNDKEEIQPNENDSAASEKTQAEDETSESDEVRIIL